MLAIVPVAVILTDLIFYEAEQVVLQQFSGSN